MTPSELAAGTSREENRTGQASASHLVARDLVKRFGSQDAISGVSFDIRQGEFFTLLGPSGCGKTTTLMALAGFQRLDEGQIIVDGEDLTRVQPHRREMGVVFQSYALFPHMTVLDNVAYPLRMRGLSARECADRALNALKMVELEERVAQRRPGALSGGQQQRVALARAMVFGPNVLLMDEPLSALDRRLRQTLQFELRRLQRRTRTTVVYVTHDQEEALVLSDRIGVMRNGRFEQVGTPEEVYRRPRSAFVAQFLGTSNTVGGRVVRLSDGSAEMRTSAGATLMTTVIVDRNVVVGSETAISVRPEDVDIVPLAVAADVAGVNRIAGRVVDVAFLGDHLRAEVELAGGEKWAVNTPLDASTDSRVLTADSEVCLRWSESAGRILPETT